MEHKVKGGGYPLSQESNYRRTPNKLIGCVKQGGGGDSAGV